MTLPIQEKPASGVLCNALVVDPVTKETREKYRRWNEAMSKLSEEDKMKEATAWINAALEIANQNGSPNDPKLSEPATKTP